MDTGGVFTTIDVPGSQETLAVGIDDAGQIVGNFFDSTGEHAFLDTGGVFTTINGTAAGISGAGQIVGFFGGGNSLDTGGVFTTLPNQPGPALGINDTGQIVGVFNDSTGEHGFFYTGGSFTAIDPPGSTDTQTWGINDAGQIVGRFTLILPEPSSLAIISVGLIGLGFVRRRKRT